MPLVKRVILPTHLSRCPESWGITGTGEEVVFQGEYDLTAVTNVTLCGALQQLASLLQAACQIHEDLDEQLGGLSRRSQTLTRRLHALEERVQSHNPKTVAVPESDLRAFSERQEHFEIEKRVSEMLFTVGSRPADIRRLYEAAAETPIHIIREIDRFRTDGFRSSMYFTCKPVFGDSLKREKMKQILEIETRRPASFVALREWGSDDETLQSELELAPVSPAAPHRPPSTPHPPDLKLPLPEQRQLALSYKYPPHLVPIDVSGRGFRRMELFRQSLVQFEFIKNRKRRRRLRRRNTIADAREVRSALNNPSNLPSTSSGQGRSSTRSCSPSSRGGISSYTDRSFDTSSTKTSGEREVGLRSHILGLEVSLPTTPRNVYTLTRHLTKEDNSFRVDSMNQHDNDILNSVAHSSPREQRKWVHKKDNVNCDEIVSEGEFTTKAHDVHSKKQIGPRLPISSSSGAINMAVKLREGNSRDEGTRSSSGNWSGSSSTRTSLESDIQQQHNHLQKATTAITTTTAVVNTTREEEGEEAQRSSKEQTVQEENGRKEDVSDIENRTSPSSSFDQESFFSESYPVLSTSPSSTPGGTASRTTDDFPSSSSHASDGTLTPTQDIQDIPFLDDDTSSAFSCDTEGYYTSFHLDSGLRSSVSYEGNKLASDSDAEVFGRGSTGTTNSSASLGTVIMRNPEKKTPPKPPQRVSSLERKENRESIITVIHVNGSASSSREDVAGAEGAEKGTVPHDGNGSRSSSKEGDSGRETSSSLTDPMSPRQQKGGSGPHDAAESLFESDADSTERKESFRMKTAINTSGIPSMCVITPPQSDDESVRSGSFHTPRDGPQGGTQIPRDGPQGGHQTPKDGPQGAHEKVSSESRVQRRVASFQLTTNNNNSKSVSFTPSCTTAVRQPGDGAVAPSVPSSSPSFTSHSTQQGYTPTLTVMSQHRSGELSAHLKVFPPAQQEPPPIPKTQPEFLSLGRSVSERRAEIQLKVLGERKPSSDVLLQRQNSREMSQTSAVTEASNLVSLKELPTTVGSAAHPFSAVPSSMKQSVVITPTNSLERRKANSKLGGAHVTLDSEGKVVYSSDSLPRQKSHTSFEPGPYIKPPPITTANGSQTKVRIPGASSIQSMPLPPVPGQQTTTTTSASAAKITEKGLDHPPYSSITPQQPKLGTRLQVSAISQTLSGLSSHMQPRTISQINSIRSAQVKSPKTVLSEGLKSVSSEEGSAQHDQPKSEETTLTSQPSYPTKFQLQTTKDRPELQSQEGTTGSAPILRKYPSLERKQEDSQAQLERLNNHRHALHSQQPQELERQNNQRPSLQQCFPTDQQPSQFQTDTESQVQQQHLLQQPSQHTLQQTQQKLQQQQEQHQQLLQQQLQLQQQQKQHILQQQHMELQKQLEQQQQQLQQHKAQQLRESQARQAEQQLLLQDKNDMQTQSTSNESVVQSRQDLQRQQLVQLQQQQQQLAAAYQQQQQPMYQLQEDAYLLRQQQTQQQLLQQQLRLQNGSQVSGPTDVIMASQGAPMSPQSQRGAYIHIQSKAPPPTGQQQPALQLDSISYPGQPHSSQGYHVGTTSRAPTPIQGLSTSSPQRLPSNPAPLQHQSLRTQPGTPNSPSPTNACEDGPDPTTDRVFLALAHARLATASLKHFKSNKSPLNNGHDDSQSLLHSLKHKTSPTVENNKLDLDKNNSQNSFLRTNSYRLATSPLTEATNKLTVKSDLTQGIRPSSRFCYPPSPLTSTPKARFKPNLARLSTGTYPGRKPQVKKTSACVNPNLQGRRLYGAHVMVNPSLLKDIKSSISHTDIKSSISPTDIETSNNGTDLKSTSSHTGQVPKENILILPRGDFNSKSLSLPRGENYKKTTTPRIVGVVRKPSSPVRDTEIW